MDFKTFSYILVTSVLINNYVLTQFLGICPFLGVSKKLNQALGMGASVIFVMVLATAATWPIQNLILVPLKLDYLQTIIFILVIASLVQLVEMVLKKFIPALHASLGVYLPLITTNCAVLAVCKNALTNETVVGSSLPFITALIYAFACGLGFLLAMVLFAGVRSVLETAKPPRCFEGVPITLVAASIVALAFSGFSGIAENLFK